MKYFLLLVAMVAGTLAEAQIGPHSRMRLALDNLFKHDASIITLQGTETMAGRSSSIGATAYWQRRNGKALLEMRIYSDGKVIQSFVGDGSCLWCYNVPRNEYVALPYEIDQQNLFALLAGQTSAHGSFIVRLLADIYGSKRSWTPYWPLGRTGESPLSDDVIIDYDALSQKRLTYRLEMIKGAFSEDPDFILKGVEYSEVQGASETSWILGISPVVAFDESIKFIFMPPAGARALSLPRKG